MDADARRRELYDEATREHAPALERIARACEADPERRRDLVQEIHVALWRSLEAFDRRCSLRTWTFRVAHNVAVSHVRRGAGDSRLVTLDELETVAAENDTEEKVARKTALDRLLALARQLAPVDRLVLLLWLEGWEAAAIGEVTGLSANNVATRVHRVKALLARRFHEGGSDV